MTVTYHSISLLSHGIISCTLQMITMLIQLLSPSGNTFYTCLPIMVSQLDVLITIKNHLDYGYEIVTIHDLSETFEDQDFVNTLNQL